jgi:DNA polymerase-3 subunit delta'
VGKAKDLASNEDFDTVKAEALSLLKYVHEMEIYEIAAALKKITEYKLEVTDYLDIFVAWYRDILLFKATKEADRLIFKEEIHTIRNAAERCSYEGIETVIRALDKAKSRLNANVNFELTMELLMLTVKECG